MAAPHDIHYFTEPPGLHQLAARCVTVGRSTTEAGEPYPPAIGAHPPSYRTVAWAGRTLDEWQIVFIEGGQGTLSVDARGDRDLRSGTSGKQTVPRLTRQRVTAGCALLLRPDEWHRYRPDSSTGWTEYWVGFSGAFLDRAATILGLCDAPTVVRLRQPEAIVRLFEALLTLAGRNEVSAHMQRLATILEMLALVSGSVNRSDRNRCSPEVVEACTHMSEFLATEHHATFSIEGVANRVGLSSSALRKRFVSALGMTPYHYFNTLRVNQVKMQLAHSRHTLQEIAERYGFTDQYHLSRVFKQYVGVSPSAWRRGA